MAAKDFIIEAEEGVLDLLSKLRQVDSAIDCEVKSEEIVNKFPHLSRENRDCWCTFHVNLLDLIRKSTKIANKLEKLL